MRFAMRPRSARSIGGCSGAVSSSTPSLSKARRWRFRPCPADEPSGVPDGGLSSRLLLDEFITQRADPGDVDLDHVAGLDVGGGAVGAHPDHVAWPKREIFCQLDDEWHDPKNHVVGAKAAG